jgi:Sulfatase-modifying factor enzyme 1
MTWTSTAGSAENLPINCVNWYQAYALCIWDGGFLPSEAEWEYTAAGGGQQRVYPWGSTDPGASNAYAIYGEHYTANLGIAPVGTAARGAGLWGQLDLAGELREWNLDSYAAYADPCTDCADTTAFSDRVMRGSQGPTLGRRSRLLRTSGSLPGPRSLSIEGYDVSRPQAAASLELARKLGNDVEPAGRGRGEYAGGEGALYGLVGVFQSLVAPQAAPTFPAPWSCLASPVPRHFRHSSRRLTRTGGPCSIPHCSTKTVRRCVHAAESCSPPQGRELTHQTALRARHTSSVTASVDGPAAPRNGRHRSHAA